MAKFSVGDIVKSVCVNTPLQVVHISDNLYRLQYLASAKLIWRHESLLSLHPDYNPTCKKEKNMVFKKGDIVKLKTGESPAEVVGINVGGKAALRVRYLSSKKMFWYDECKLEFYQQHFTNKEVWSESEEGIASHQYHSQYWEGCEYERIVRSRVRNGETSATTTYRIRLDNKPKTVKVSELTGTVKMVDGKPDWSTYRE